MFNPRNAPDPNVDAMAARRQALIDADQMGHPHTAPCVLLPSDRLTVQRVGARNLPTTLVGVTITTAAGPTFVNITPADARREAIAMMDAADEAEGVTRLGFAVPATPELATRLLAGDDQ